MSGFEDYLKKNRDSLKLQESADDKMWYAIKNEIANRRRFAHIKVVFGAAAGLILLLASATFIKIYFGQTSDSYAEQTLPLYYYSEEYGNIEIEFIEAVEYQKQLVRDTSIPSEYQSRFQSFIKGMEALDAAYQTYKTIIIKDGCDNIMTGLIIENYQRKLDLLQSLHQELIKINEYENISKTKYSALEI